MVAGGSCIRGWFLSLEFGALSDYRLSDSERPSKVQGAKAPWMKIGSQA